jgi:phosphate transport system protein
MPRTELDRRLGELRATVVLMGESADAAIGRAIEALACQDRATAQDVIAGDDALDRTCTAIEQMSAHVITLQQPAIRDLRAVLAALAIAEDLERIGDYAEGIAQLVLRLPDAPDAATMLALSGLAALARVQLHGALDAYRACDATRAREVWVGDNAVDGLYSRVVQSLLRAMSADQDAVTTDTYLLWVAHNLERIADRATNICERVVFIATGERTMPAAVAS